MKNNSSLSITSMLIGFIAVAIAIATLEMRAGDNSEHPPGVLLSPAIVITDPHPLFPPAIEALRNEIKAQEKSLSYQYKLYRQLVASKDPAVDSDTISGRWADLRNSWALVGKLQANLDQMLAEYRASIATDHTDTPYDPAVADAPITPGS